MKSGLKASGKEFVFGIYDGVTGLAVQPYIGARDNGPVGCVKGVGMGLTGFVLKSLAAVTGPVAYTLKGSHKELLKSRQPTKFIRKAKIMQGYLDHRDLSEAELKQVSATIAHGWSVIEQVSDVMDSQLREGLSGKIRFLKQRRKLKEKGGFENIEKAEKALESWKGGGRPNGFGVAGKMEPEKTKINTEKDISQAEDPKLPDNVRGNTVGPSEPQTLRRATTAE